MSDKRSAAGEDGGAPGSNDAERDGTRGRSDRRQFLKAAGAVAASVSIAGCNSVKEQRFEAAPVALSSEARDHGYVLEEARTVDVTREVSAAGQTVEATVVNHLAAYDRTSVQTDSEFIAKPAVGLLSTPAAEVLGRSFNPLATRPLSELLQADVGNEFLESLGVDSTRWEQGPREVGSVRVSILDQPAEATTFLGVVGDSLVLINAARVNHQGDVVIVGDAHTRTYEGGSPTAAVDEGSREQAHEVFAELTPYVVRKEAEGGTTPPTRTPQSNLERSPFTSLTTQSLGGGYKRYKATVEIPAQGEGTFEKTVILDDLNWRQYLNSRTPDRSSPLSSLGSGAPELDEPEGEVALVGDVPEEMAAMVTEPPDELLSGTRPPPQASLRQYQTPLRNQFGRGTCVNFCVTAAMEAHLNRQGFPPLNLSEQYNNHITKMPMLHMQKGDPTTDKCVGGMRNGPADTDIFENQLAMWDGASVGSVLGTLTRYGLPEERNAQFQPPSAGDPTYVQDARFSKTNQTGDDPWVKFCNPGTATQKDINDFNVEHDFIQVPIAKNRTLKMRPFPREALKNANYRLQSYVYLGFRGPKARRSSNRKRLDSPRWYEEIIGNRGREVILSYPTSCLVWHKKKPDRKNFSSSAKFRQAMRKWKNNNGDVWTHDTSKGCGAGHCILLVGYKRNANPPHFIAKNSWNTYTKLGYDVIKDGIVNEAAIVTGVKKAKGSLRDQDFLGRWDVVYDGKQGTLDIYRKPGSYPPRKLGGAKDARIGTFFDASGRAYRVNGTLDAGNNRMTATYDTAIGAPLDYGQTGDIRFEGFMAYEDRDFLSGTFSGIGGNNQPTKGFFATPSGQQPRSPTTQYGSLQPKSFLGEWVVRSSVFDGAVEVNSVTASTTSFQGTMREVGGATGSIFGIANASTGELSFRFPSQFGNWKFRGYIHTDALGRISGRVQKGGVTERPMLLTRVGLANPTVKILRPVPGAQISAGKGITLEASVTGDPNPGPALIWTIDGPYNPGGQNKGTILGTGGKVNASIGVNPGTHTITATYTNTSPSKTDDVQITVV